MQPSTHEIIGKIEMRYPGNTIYWKFRIFVIIALIVPICTTNPQLCKCLKISSRKIDLQMKVQLLMGKKNNEIGQPGKKSGIKLKLP